MNINNIKPNEWRKNKQFKNSGFKITKKLNSLITSAKKTFNGLRQAFIKAQILQYFDLKSYIWIKIDISGYAKDKILNQQSSKPIIFNFSQ